MWGRKKPVILLLLAVFSAGTLLAQTGKRPSAKSPKPAAVQTQPEAGPAAEPAPPQTPEEMPPQPPQVTYRNGMLTIVARNSTLADVMSAVRAQTGATVETPQNAVSERVVSRLGPAPPQEVLAALLNGSKFDFVILGNSGGGLQHVILTARTGGADETAAAPSSPGARNAGARSNPRRPPVVEEDEEAPEEPGMDETPDESREVPEDTTPPVQTPAQNPNLPPGAVPPPGQQPPGQQTTPAQPVPGQPQIKTPEQLLEDLRRLQQQQQQQQNPPAPAPE